MDLIVIGAGPGGYDVAAHEAAKGKEVVIIEKDLPGGTCLNRGCIPTKCLCAGAEMISDIKRAEDFGIEIPGYTLSYGKAVERSRQVVATLRQGVESLLGKCRFVRGEAEIMPGGTVKVGDEEFSAPKVIIATGSKPAALGIPGAELAMTSDGFLNAVTLPDEIVIIGGGVIGLEFAYIAAAYGKHVTVIEYCKEILPPFDAELAKRLRLSLVDRGIKFITSAAVEEIVKEDDGRLTVGFRDKKGENTVSCDAVLMAVGRRPVVPKGLTQAGIETDARGFIVTDENMLTTRPGFYAVGDCNGRMMLAHAATAQAMRAVGEDVNLDVIPSAVFTSPELAMVGLTTEQCKERGISYVAKKALYRANGKALASGHSEGLVKALVEPDSGLLLGCHILGAHAADLIQEAALAMSQGISVDRMARQTVHGHPTLSEILPSALCS